MEKACYWSPSKREKERREKERPISSGERQKTEGTAQQLTENFKVRQQNELQTTVREELSG